MPDELANYLALNLGMTSLHVNPGVYCASRKVFQPQHWSAAPPSNLIAVIHNL